MGLFDFIMSAPKMEHIKMAYVGRFVFQNLQDREIKSELYWLANEMANYNLNSSSEFDKDYFANMTMRTQYILLAIEMMGKGIDHGLQNFQWYFVKKPQLVQYYDDNLWYLSKKSLKKRSGIDVDFIPKGEKGDVMKPE